MATTAESARDADSSATFDKSAESGAVADAGGSPDEYATTAPGAPAPVNGAIVTPTTASLPDLGSFDDDRTLAASVDALVDDLTGSGPASDGSDRATNDAVPTTTASPPGFPAADPAESCPSAVDPDAVPFARATVDGHPVTVFGGPAADRMGVRTFLVDLTDCAVRTL
jgi:hypothetical protein